MVVIIPTCTNRGRFPTKQVALDGNYLACFIVIINVGDINQSAIIFNKEIFINTFSLIDKNKLICHYTIIKL
jgi:hypothetical protein